MIKDLPKKEVLIIGDCGVDEYIIGDAVRLSSEAPVPILNNLKTEKRLGLAANVANNIKALGSEPSLISVVGPYDREVRKLFEDNGVWAGYVYVDTERKTTRKTRILAGQTQLVRMDEETTDPISTKTEQWILNVLDKAMPKTDIVIVQDYGKGVITRRIMDRITELAEKYGLMVLVDPHGKEIPSMYWGATVLTPNKQECFELTRNFHPYSAEDATRLLKQSTNAKTVLTTLGKDGMHCQTDTKSFNLKSNATEVVDVTGAGDTVISALTIGLAMGLEIEFAAQMANTAAGIVVKKLGTSVCTKEELLSVLGENLKSVHEYHADIQEIHKKIEKAQCQCTHSDSKVMMYSWRPGAFSPARICNACNKVVLPMVSEAEYTKCWDEFNKGSQQS